MRVMLQIIVQTSKPGPVEFIAIEIQGFEVFGTFQLSLVHQSSKKSLSKVKEQNLEVHFQASNVEFWSFRRQFSTSFATGACF